MSSVRVVVFCPGPTSAGMPLTLGSPPGAAIFPSALSSCDSRAFFSCAGVVPFFSLKPTIMWSSTPVLSKLICVQPALGLPLSR